MDKPRRNAGQRPSHGADDYFDRPRNQAKRPASREIPDQEVYLEPIEGLDFDDMPQEAPPVRFQFAQKKQKRTVIALLCCAVALLTMIVVYYFAEQQKRQAAEIASQLAAEEALRLQQEQERVEYEAMTSSTLFAEGITVDGVAIGGMTREQAATALQPVVQKFNAAKEMQLTYGTQLYSLDLSSAVTTNNLDTVLNEAYALGKSGEYEALKTELSDIKQNGRMFSLTTNFDASVIQAKVAELAAQVDTPVKNAFVSNVNTEDNTIEFADPVPGAVVDQAALTQTITEALLSGNTAAIMIPIQETPPTVTKEMLAAQYIKRSSFTTDYSTSTSDRKYNVRKGAGMITGTILKPDEVFSTNDTLGTRTTGNGWKMANAYESGAVVPQAGGGVCQLSTTLYNAVVKADLEIVFRRNHSMPVAYVDKGLDATINSVGNIIDFKFKNNTGSDVVIFAYTTNNKKLTFEIWGVPFASDEYDEIKLSSELVETYNPEGDVVRIEVPEGTEKADGGHMKAGEEYVAIASRKGYKYQSYKSYYKNGNKVRSEPLASSTYKAYAGEIWVAPGPSVTPEIFVTPDPFFPNIPTDPGVIPPMAVDDPFADLPAGAF